MHKMKIFHYVLTATIFLLQLKCYKTEFLKVLFIIQIQSSKTARHSRKQKTAKWKNKGPYTPFPPAQLLSKIDIQLESGEYFLNETERCKQKSQQMLVKQMERKTERKKLRSAELIPPLEPSRLKMFVKNTPESTANIDSFDLNKLKKKIKFFK